MASDNQAVIKAVETIRNASKNSPNEKVHHAIKQLSSSVVLLNLSNPPKRSMEKLSSILRDAVQPLYAQFFMPTLQYCVAVSSVLNERADVATQCGNIETQNAWEGLQNALLSGILDFLEKNGNEKIKSSIASTFYTLLCDRYLPASHSSANITKNTNLHLKCSVYTLLSESAESNATNQRTLRDPATLGGLRIGRALSRSSEFLAVEAILSLVAVLLPSYQSAKEKRSQFLDAVFDQKLFSKSKELKALLLPVSDRDWEEVSLQVIKMLSNISLSFPQPFIIDVLTINDSPINVTSCIYIDNGGITANIDIGGSYETFHVPFTIIQEISVQDRSSSTVSVHVILTEAPLRGITPMKIPRRKTISLVLVLKREELIHFLKTLRFQGIKVEQSTTEAKMSLLEKELPMVFDTMQPSFPEKIQKYNLGPSSPRVLRDKSPNSNKSCTTADPPLTTSKTNKVAKASALRITDSDDDVSEFDKSNFKATSIVANIDTSTDHVAAASTKSKLDDKGSVQGPRGPSLRQTKKRAANQDELEFQAPPSKRQKPTEDISDSPVYVATSEDKQDAVVDEVFPTCGGAADMPSPPVLDKSLESLNIGVVPKTQKGQKVTYSRRAMKGRDRKAPVRKNLQSSTNVTVTTKRQNNAGIQGSAHSSVIPPVGHAAKQSTSKHTESERLTSADVDIKFSLKGKTGVNVDKSTTMAPWDDESFMRKLSPTKPLMEETSSRLDTSDSSFVQDFIVPLKMGSSDDSKSPELKLSKTPVVNLALEDDAKIAQAEGVDISLMQGDRRTAIEPMTANYCRATPPRSRLKIPPIRSMQAWALSHEKEDPSVLHKLPQPDAQTSTQIMVEPRLLEDQQTDSDQTRNIHIDNAEKLDLVNPHHSFEPPSNTKLHDQIGRLSPATLPLSKNVEVLPHPAVFVASQQKPALRPPYRDDTRSFKFSTSKHLPSYLNQNNALISSPETNDKQLLNLSNHRTIKGEQEEAQRLSRDIMDVLNDIHVVIGKKMYRRFEAVKENVRISLNNIVRDATLHVEDLWNETTDHYKAFLDLHEKYATFDRNLLEGFDDVKQVSTALNRQLVQVLQEHDRRSLTKKFPESLLSPPTILSKGFMA